MSESFEREKITVHSLESRPAFQEGFSNVDVFKRMVKAFTGVNLQIKEVETEKEFHRPVGNVKIKFDLFAEDEKKRTIVEAQHANYSQNFERFCYYHLTAIVETIKSSRDYHFPKTVYTLVFFTDRLSPVPGKNILVHDTEMKDFIDGEVAKGIFPHKHRLFFIFTKAPDADIRMPEECREWIQAIHETLKGWVYLHQFKTPEIKTLFERLKTEDTSPELHTKMMDERMVKEKHDDIRKEERRKIARKLLRRNATTSNLDISELTELSLTDIEELREEMTEKGEILFV
ncbi:MAG: hypothetical protein DRR08_20235 [Candidatus Parabeggiatoa sp. nov. 2]|nr:MAG: hypothetical protein B6247_26110 [Beggiatoa sp. 4572_84]RKZ56975.1 MAG: hypothetical protein DRR08_20235 [Gammaproteobacteria bacterium]